MGDGKMRKKCMNACHKIGVEFLALVRVFMTYFIVFILRYIINYFYFTRLYI